MLNPGKTGKLALAAALLFVATTALADDRQKALQAFKLGTQHYELAEYNDALQAFKEAYRAHEDPSILFNIGQCYRQLGDKDQAVRFYRMYLIKEPDAPNRLEVRDQIARLELAIAHPEPSPAKPSEPMPPKAAEPSASVAARQPVLVASPSPRTPVYKKWWVWTTAGVIAVGAGVGLGVGLSHGPAASATTSFGTVHPF
jgi:tetratricopeptide (TPR) repeat protein